MPNLDSIKTIVVVMMENRSFDHLLGYLSLPPYSWPNVDGLHDDPAWKARVSSVYGGSSFPPFVLDDPYDLMEADPPHERDPISLQLGEAKDGTFPMNGFVSNLATVDDLTPIKAGDKPPVMGYFTAEEIPVIDFFAQNFAVCDHWFSSLPAGTQPNRLMAMSGFTDIDVNTFPLPDQYLVYDWLIDNKIRWRVYHEGMPFFAMMPRWIPDILVENHFHPLAKLFDDVQNEPPGEFPQVIFVEPMYTDAPHIGPSTDDHAPSAVQGGQRFLFEVYRSMSLVPDIWEGTVMIVTYDEHGGFFDHVSPPAILTKPSRSAKYQKGFGTLGVRVPGLVLSPFVKPRTVFNGVLDHTSILKFIAQKFGNGEPYSDLVDNRKVGSVFEVLNLDVPRAEIPVVPSLVDYLNRRPPPAGYTPTSPAPTGAIPKGFKQALDTMRIHPLNTKGKFGDLSAAFPPGL